MMGEWELPRVPGPGPDILILSPASTREIDSRGSYLALAVASLCNILTPELRQGAAGYLLR